MLVDPDNLDQVADEARVLLSSFLGLAPPQAAERAQELLAPDSESFDLIFAPEVAEHAREYFTAQWREGIAPIGRPDQRHLEVYAVTVTQLREQTGHTRQFPGGYRRVADVLRPGPIWVRWRLAAAPGGSGMAYDGLVRLPQRWVWLPKPWRAVALDDPAQLTTPTR